MQFENTSNTDTGLFEIPSDDNEDIIDLPLLKTDIVKNLEHKKQEEIKERSNAFTRLGICYCLCIVCVIIVLDVSIYYSIPECDDCSNSDDGLVTTKPTISPSLTLFPAALTNMSIIFIGTNYSSTNTQPQLPTKSVTPTPTVSLQKSTSSPISISTKNSNPSPTLSQFHCGATKEEAELCLYSCAVNPCPMFEYCFEVTTCTAFA